MRAVVHSLLDLMMLFFGVAAIISGVCAFFAWILKE